MGSDDRDRPSGSTASPWASPLSRRAGRRTLPHGRPQPHRATDRLRTSTKAFLVAYITHISTAQLRGIPPLEIALAAAKERPFRHLVLTGPNGTGKTSILSAIAGELSANLTGRRIGRNERAKDRLLDASSHVTKAMVSLTEIQAGRAADKSLLWDHVDLTWTAPLDELQQEFASGRMIACYLPARRGIEVERVKAISAEEYKIWSMMEPATPQLLQFLVNRKAQQSFARDDDDDATAEGLEEWFRDIEQGMALLLGEDDLHLEFDRKQLTFRLVSGARRYDLLELAHGHAAALGILAELLLRVELSHEDDDVEHDSGVVLIDEPEMHLHLELQERILPALVAMFPHVQFIVATHSPVIVSSIDDALVFDLEDRQPRRSEELRGRPYGWIMKRNFGLEEDFDLATTELLHELDTLRRLASLTPEQQARLEELAEQLSGTSHALALEVWNRVLASRLERREAQGKAAK